MFRRYVYVWSRDWLRRPPWLDRPPLPPSNNRLSLQLCQPRLRIHNPQHLPRNCLVRHKVLLKNIRVLLPSLQHHIRPLRRPLWRTISSAINFPAIVLTLETTLPTQNGIPLVLIFCDRDPVIREQHSLMESLNSPTEFLTQHSTERRGLWFREAEEGDAIRRG